MSAAFAGTAMARLARVCWSTLAVAVLLSCLCGSAWAAQGWQVVSTSNTTVAAGDQLTYYVDLVNRGDSNTDRSLPSTLTVTLPDGMEGVSFEDFSNGYSCASVAGETVITCTSSQAALPDTVGEVRLTVAVDAGASGVKTARFDIEGGGLAPASTVDPVRISDTPPPFGIDAFDGRVSDAAGAPFTQAGGHPFSLSTALDVNTATDTSPTSSPFQPIVGPNQPVETLKDVVVDLPPGLVGNPTGVAQCTTGQLSNTEGVTPEPLCPITSQVGTAMFLQNGTKLGNVVGPAPIFNMVPPPNVPARFGINVAGTMVLLDASVRTGSDYGLTVTSRHAPAGIAVIGAHVEFWGVPSDPSHDSERSCPGQPGAGSPGGPSCTSGAPRAAFFRNPTSCTPPGVGLVTTARAASWQDPGDFDEASFVSHAPLGYPFVPSEWGPEIGPDGCERVPFDPAFDAQPLAGAKAAGPSAFAFDIAVPQGEEPEAVGQADLKKAVVTLPEGVRVNPSSADGLGVCDSGQIALRSDAMPTCPESSKVGSVTIDTPLLDVPVTGGVYLAKPFDNPFGSLIAVYVVASAKGVVIKLPGEVSMDPKTGQITSTFDNNPQLPFSRLHLELKSGPRAPLALPNRCGVHTTRAELTGWNGKVVSHESSFTLSENAKGKPCPPQFSPGFSAGTESNGAGSSSSFLMRLTRSDEDQALSGVTVKLPRGLTGRIASAGLCSDGQVSSSSCPASSKVGDVTVGAGAGSNPFFITNGQAYLTGPYKGAPYGIAIVVPAVAGPFDLGMVTVRSALHVDRRTAQVRVVSDPLPTILQGIPLDVRDVRVNVNRPGFVLNPTSCAVMKVAGTLTSTEGATANVSDRFQAAECASLGFSPRLKMRMTGGRRQTVGSHPGLKVALTRRAGQANIKRVEARLPLSLALDPDNANALCEYEEGIKDEPNCPKGSIVGRAKAVTPLLKRPLRGKVYFVKNVRIHPKTGNRIRTLPMLVVALRGEIAINLRGVSTSKGGKLTSVFPAPDAPVSRFDMRIKGGKGGILTIARRIPCNRQSAEVYADAHSGKTHDSDVPIRSTACSNAKRSKLVLRRPKR